MFRLNQIDENHIQFSGSIEDTIFEKESFKDEMYNLQDRIENEDVFGQVEDKIYNKTFVDGNINPQVNVSKISHKITNVNVDEEHDYVYGTMEILDTPEGKVIKELMKHNCLNYMKATVSCIGNYDGKSGDQNKFHINNFITFNLKVD